jgi:hypothetical protein
LVGSTRYFTAKQNVGRVKSSVDDLIKELYRSVALAVLAASVAINPLTDGFATPRPVLLYRIPRGEAAVGRTRRSWLRANPVDPTGVVPGENDGNSATPRERSILQILDEAGQSLKPKAAKANEKANVAGKKGKKLLYILQTCFLYTLFIFYRAYRGVFVIVPAVFREVYRKMQNTVDNPFDPTPTGSESSDRDPQTGKVRWRTRITVSLLASVVTVSYVLSGALRVLAKLLRTMTTTSDVSGSFAAAADEQEKNEFQIARLGKDKARKAVNGDGHDDTPSSPLPEDDLAP